MSAVWKELESCPDELEEESRDNQEERMGGSHSQFRYSRGNTTVLTQVFTILRISVSGTEYFSFGADMAGEPIPLLLCARRCNQMVRVPAGFLGIQNWCSHHCGVVLPGGDLLL
jgi:hypothetical protein